MFKAIAFLVTLVVTSISAMAVEKRMTAPQLFSEKTIAYLRVDNVIDFRTKLSQTATGKLLDEPELKPFFGTFYDTFMQLGQRLQKEIGISLEELLSLPAGEFAIAVLPGAASGSSGANSGDSTGSMEPEICIMLDVGSELPALEIMLKRISGRVEENGNARTATKIGELEVFELQRRGGGGQLFSYFLDNGVFVAGKSQIKSLAERWVGMSKEKFVPLADNSTFTTLLGRCVGTQGERPQISFYIDPVAFFRETIRSSPNALMSLAAIKTIGLDGLKAVGGSIILATNDFDSVLHCHVTMDQPRPGVLSLLRPKNGSIEPESWVGENVVSYATANWDVNATLNAIRKIVDTFTFEGNFDESVLTPISSSLGIDVKKDAIDQIDDRFTLSSVVLPARRLNSQSSLVGIHVRNPQFVGSNLLPKLFSYFQKGDSRWSKKDVFGINIYYLNHLQRSNEFIRIPQPAFALLKDNIILGDSLEALEIAIDVHRAEEALLSESIEFRLIHDKIKAQLDNKDFSIMSYSRPDEQIKLFYELGNDPKNIAKLEESAGENPFIQALVAALKSGKLPPFEKIAKHLAPTGAFVTEEDDGLHYTAFTLRRD